MGLSHPKYKVAAVQAASAFLDIEAGIEKTRQLIAEAAAHGARLIAFPEAWIPGYPWFIWLGPPAWGMQFTQRYFDNSITSAGPELAALADAAAKHRIEVVVGCSERDGGSLYLGQAFISAAGELRCVRRKLRPTHVERAIFGDGDGSHFRVFDTELGRIGALLCWEHLQPLSRYAMFTKREQVHVASWPSFSLYNDFAYALGPELNLALSSTYAAEGQCFVIASCGIVTREMLELMQAPCPPEFLRAGGGYAMIFGPDGRPLAAPLPPDQEGILYAEIDLSAIALAKVTADPTGHYARPDVARLLLNEQPMSPVEPLHIAMRAPVPPASENAAEQGLGA